MFLIRELLVGGRSGVDYESFGITHVGQIGCQLQVVHDASTELRIALYAEREDAAELALAKKFFGAVGSESSVEVIGRE